MKLFKKKPMREILLIFAMFGLAVGLAFPFFASIFIVISPQVKLIFISSCLLAGVLVGVANFFIFKSIISKINNNYKNLAKQKLGITVEDESSDVLRSLYNNFESFFTNTSNITNKIIELSTTLKTSSVSFKQWVQEVSNSMNDIAVSSNDICMGVKKTEEISENAKNVIEIILNLVEKISGISKNIVASSNNVSVVIQNGNNAYNELTFKMKNLSQKADRNNEIMQDLRNASEKINNILQIISGITGEINLLSLNAMIESARAGEYGRGFGVVAEEVRNLADSSSAQTTEINNIISNLIEKVEMLVSSQKDMQDELQSDIEVIDKTRNALMDINDETSKTNQLINEIVNINKVESENINNISDILTNGLYTSIRNDMEGTERASASTEQINASLQEVLAETNQLFEIAADLEKNANLFKIE